MYSNFLVLNEQLVKVSTFMHYRKHQACYYSSSLRPKTIISNLPVSNEQTEQSLVICSTYTFVHLLLVRASSLRSCSVQKQQQNKSQSEPYRQTTLSCLIKDRQGIAISTKTTNIATIIAPYCLYLLHSPTCKSIALSNQGYCPSFIPCYLSSPPKLL